MINISLKKLRNKVYFHIIGKNEIKIRGKNNCIKRDDSSYIKNTCISICGNNNVIIFGNNCNISGLKILVMGDDNLIEFGKEVRINASTFQPTVINAVGGKSIKIGEGALLSNNIEIHTTDYHGIYDSKGNRVNPDKSILIGKYVWIGLGSKILKGTEIADGCVVGAGSVLSGTYANENVIIVGNPGTVIKEKIFWKLHRTEHSEVPNVLKRKWDL